MNPLNIHDIKSLHTIPDYSLYLFIFLILLGIVVISILLYMIYKSIKNRSKNERKEYYQILQNIDFSNPKQAAYTITKYTRLLASTPREIKLTEELIHELEIYKYKKEIAPIEAQIITQFEILMEALDV